MDGASHHGTVYLGENAYGATNNYEVEYMENIIVTNVISNARDHAVCVEGSLRRSVIHNVIYGGKKEKAIILRQNNNELLQNVSVTNIQADE